MNGVSVSVSYQVGRPAPSRETVMQLQAALEDMPDAMGAEECEDKFNEHFFAPGMYGRLMHIPAGMCIVGKIHKHAHINVITRGRVKVVSEFGEDLYEGPKIWVSEPGTKRAVYALEDTDWMTVHANPDDLTDVREIEKQVIADSFSDFDRLQLERGEET